MKKIIIDTDPGIGALGADIDDGLAIVMALNSEKLQVLGLTTVNGNVTCDQGTINALNLLEVMNRKEVPVCKGADRPLVGDMKFVRETFAEILDRAGWKEPLPVKASTLQPRPEHAVDFIIDQVCRYPGEVTMVCIGPLTNLALAIRKMPQLPELIHETIIMGGGWTQPLDCITPVAEFNMFCDPEAAKIVLHSGMPLYMTGYELCKKTQLKPEHLAILGQRQTPTSQFIARMAEPWLAFMKAPSPLDPEYGAQVWLNRPGGLDGTPTLFPGHGPDTLVSMVGHLGQYVAAGTGRDPRDPAQMHRVVLVRLGKTQDGPALLPVRRAMGEVVGSLIE